MSRKGDGHVGTALTRGIYTRLTSDREHKAWHFGYIRSTGASRSHSNTSSKFAEVNCRSLFPVTASAGGSSMLSMTCHWTEIIVPGSCVCPRVFTQSRSQHLGYLFRFASLLTSRWASCNAPLSSAHTAFGCRVEGFPPSFCGQLFLLAAQETPEGQIFVNRGNESGS